MQPELNNENREKVQWTNETNLQEAEKLKQQGNRWFSKKQYKNALKKYHQAILHLAGIVDKSSAVAMYTTPATKQVSNSANTLKFSVWLNMSQIYIYQQKYEKGLQILKKAEQLSQKCASQNAIGKTMPKLFYRKGVCYMKMNYFQQAKTTFNKLKQIDESFNKEIQQFQKQIKQRQKIAEQKAKKVFQGFFK